VAVSSQLPEKADHDLADGADLLGDLLLRPAERDRSIRPDRTRPQVSGQPGAHGIRRLRRQPLDEAAHTIGQSLEKRPAKLRVRVHRDHQRRAVDDEAGRRSVGDRARRVGASGEQRYFTESCAGPFSVQHVLAVTSRADDANPSGEEHEQPTRFGSGCPEAGSTRESPRDGPRGQLLSRCWIQRAQKIDGVDGCLGYQSDDSSMSIGQGSRIVGQNDPEATKESR
jgi:hypothetical protein